MRTSSRRRSPVAYVVGALVVLIGLYVAFELGRYRAGYSLIDSQRAIAQYRAQIAAERAANDELRRQVAVLETSREIDKATYAQIEASLADLEARIQAQEEELAFYRGIVSPQDGVPGLRVQSVQAESTDQERRYTLRLVLVQAIVHNRRVKGTVTLRLAGLHDGESASFDVAALAPAEEGESTGSTDFAYDFRYFQGLDAEVVLPVGFEPQELHVEIRPREPRGDMTTQSFDWAAIVR
jgi:hypothetical protein